MIAFYSTRYDWKLMEVQSHDFGGISMEIHTHVYKPRIGQNTSYIRKSIIQWKMYDTFYGIGMLISWTVCLSYIYYTFMRNMWKADITCDLGIGIEWKINGSNRYVCVMPSYRNWLPSPYMNIWRLLIIQNYIRK